MRRYLLGVAVALLALVTIGLLSYRTSVAPGPDATLDTPAALFGNVSLKLEFATTTAARERGLSGRESIPVDYGMLFAFPTDGEYGFWMKDTLIPLDIFWLDAQGQVVHIANEVATSSYPSVFYPPVPARYVLETTAGFAREHRITTGTRLQLQNFPTVSE